VSRIESCLKRQRQLPALDDVDENLSRGYRARRCMCSLFFNRNSVPRERTKTDEGGREGGRGGEDASVKIMRTGRRGNETGNALDFSRSTVDRIPIYRSSLSRFRHTADGRNLCNARHVGRIY